MKIESFYQPLVISCSSSDDLREAARRMEAADIGALPVVDADRVVGIISERDIARAFSKEADPGRAPVSRYASADVETASLDEDSFDAARRMVDAGFRHLPVTRDERVLGIVSMRDLLALEVFSVRTLLRRGWWRARKSHRGSNSTFTATD